MNDDPVWGMFLGMMEAVAGAPAFIRSDNPGFQRDGMAEHSPLFILLKVMRDRWEAEDVEGAVALARVVAPYLHGRAAITRPAGELAGVPDDELDEWTGGLGGAAAAGEDPG